MTIGVWKPIRFIWVQSVGSKQFNVEPSGRNLWSVSEAEADLKGLCMQENHQAMKYFIKFQQLAAHVQWGEAALHRQAYNGLAKCIKDNMIHHEKPNSLSGLQKLVEAMMHNTGNDVGKFPTKPILPEPPETILNRSPTPPSQITSPAKVLPSSNRRTTTLALPRARLNFQTEKSTTPDLSSKLRKDRKLTPQEVTAPSWSQTLPLLWHLWTHCQGLSKIHLGFLQRLSSPTDSTWPKDCIELPCVKTLTLYTSTLLNSNSLTLSWLLTLFLIWSWGPLWILDLPTPLLILCLFRLSISLLMAFCLSSSDSLMKPPTPSSHRH